VRVIARKTLRQFVEALKGSKDQKAVKSALDAWFHEVLGAEWKGPADVLKAYANASTARPHRVVFDIKGNDRLVAATNYRHRIEFIKWIGTDADYNEIEVETVRYGHQTDSRRSRLRASAQSCGTVVGFPEGLCRKRRVGCCRHAR
jgi:mRNA interferase HigB